MLPEEKSESVQEPIQEKVQVNRFWPALFILASLIILAVALLIMRSLRTIESTPTPASAVRPTMVEDEITARLQQENPSDEISTIKVDLETTDFSGLDQELEEIEIELGAP